MMFIIAKLCYSVGKNEIRVNFNFVNLWFFCILNNAEMGTIISVSYSDKSIMLGFF